MPVDVVTATTIHRPVEEVASYAADPSNAPDWYANIVSAQWETPPPVQLGTRVLYVARFLGRRLEYTTTYTWEALDGDRTRMTLRNQGQPKGFSKIAAPVMTTAIRRANQQDLEKLRTILEGAAPA